jgi:hypothetical protein
MSSEPRQETIYYEECPGCGDEIPSPVGGFIDGEAYKCLGCKRYWAISVDPDTGDTWVQDDEE